MQKGFFSDAPQTAHGMELEKAHPFAAITWPEVTGVALLASVSIVVGVYPKILLDTIEPAVKALLAGGGR
jgi:NADH-quinone oxidoreductase subunit M